jgi:undecaprenyl-diphosphatase
MTVWQALVLGVIQGLTEFLPISSSAHLALAPRLFHFPDPGLAADVALHVGTLLAVVWFFKSAWRGLIVAAWSIVVTRRVETDEQRRVLFLILATIPGVIAGVLLEEYAETTFRSPAVIGVTLIVMGVLLWWIDRRSPATHGLERMRWTHALGFGLAQMLAIVPGVSRSGSTITAGRALGFSRESAAVFSFLMSMPITAGAALMKVPEVVREQGITVAMLVGVAAAGISGWLAIAVLLRFVARRSYGVFAAYRLVLGVIVLALWYSGWFSA